nr:retrovirus-related Pol polyprotein from transposon TNT 1-94 [Tanacetum cinerariifolium]
MSTQQDIYAAGFKSRPPMLNKENYVPWSSRLLRYAKSRPNGKLIHNSIINGPYTDDEFTEKELKQIEADDQAIQTILLGLPKDIYAAVDSCETAQEIWLRVKQMMKGSDIGIQEKKAKFTSNEGESIESYYHRFLKLMNDLKRNKHFLEKIASNLKFLNNLQPEWSRHVTIVHQTKDLHTADYTQLYDFLKYNQKENYMQQPMPNPEDITDPTTAMNMALALMAKAFKLNYSTPTNNNQRISSNPHNRQIAQPVMNMGQDRHMQMVRVQNVRNQVVQNAVQNPRVQNIGNHNGLIGVPRNANQNLHGNGNLVAVCVEGNAAGQNGNQIRCYNCRGVGHFARNCTVRPRRRDAAYLQTQLLIAQKEEAGIQLHAEEFDLMAAAADLDEIEEVNANCILMANLQQASTSVTQTDKAPVYDSDGSAEGNILITRVYFVEGLGHNLFSIGQFCDSDLEVAFRRNACFVRNLDGVDLLKGDRLINLYTINLHEMASVSPICLMARASFTKSWLWHQRLSHLNFNTINDLAKNDLVLGLPKFKYLKEYLCPSYEQGKNKKASHPPKPIPNSRQRLHLLHMDLCGPMRITSINRKRYVLVIVYDYSRYTWVHFLRSKDEAPEVIKMFLKRITVLLQSPVIIIRTDNGTEFKNQVLKEYFDSIGISYQMSSVRTPHQNGIVERRNRTLVEAARTILIFSRAPLFLWDEVIATACFTQNRSIIHRRFNKTPYELINGRKPNISFLHVFRALCYPKNDHEDIGKLGAKSDIGFFIGYSVDSCAYRVYNRRTKKIMETMNVSFDELSAMAFEQRSSKPRLQTMYDDYIGGQPSSTARTVLAAQEPQQQGNQAHLQSTTVADNVSNAMFDENTFVNLFANPSTSVAESSSSQTNQLRFDGDMCIYALTVSTMKSKTVKEAMTDPVWIKSMQEELLQFKRLDVWVLVPAPDNISPLTLKWLFKNKHDEEQTVIRNKIEAIMIFLAYATYKSFSVFQMDLKTAFLHGSLKEDVYVCQPKGFINVDHPSHVYKLQKALYGLKQAPRAWSVDDIIFSSTHPRYIQLFFDLMKSRFEMSMMREMTCFLGLQVNQSPCGIFINQSNYVLEILKKYGMESCDPVGNPMEIKDKLDLDQNGTPVDAIKYRSMIGALMYLTSSRPDIVHATCLCARYQAKPTEKHLKEVKRIFRYLKGTVNTGLWYTKDSGFELTGFSDADYAGCKDSFKSTFGGAQFLSEKLLTDYGFYFNKIPIYCDSKSAIAISCNLVQHSRTKHIAVRYHFIKEHVEKGTTELYFVKMDYQLADLFTKGLPAERFNYLVHHLGMRSLSPQELDCLAKSQ